MLHLTWARLSVSAPGFQSLWRLNRACAAHSLGERRHPWRWLLTTVVLAHTLCRPVCMYFKNVNDELSPQPRVCPCIPHQLLPLDSNGSALGCMLPPASELVSWKTHVPAPSLSGQNWLRDDTIPKSDLQLWGGWVGGCHGPSFKINVSHAQL